MKIYKYLIVIALAIFLSSCVKEEDIIGGGDDGINDPGDFVANCELLTSGIIQGTPNTAGSDYLKLKEEINRIASDLITEVPATDEFNPNANLENYKILMERISKCEDLVLVEICYACDKFQQSASVFSISAKTKDNEQNTSVYVKINTVIQGEPLFVISITTENPLGKKDEEITANCTLLEDLVYETKQEDPTMQRMVYTELAKEINRIASDLPLNDDLSWDPMYHKDNFAALLTRLRDCDILIVEELCYACPEYYQGQSVFSVEILTSDRVYTRKYITMKTDNQGEAMTVSWISAQKPYGGNESKEVNCQELYGGLFDENIAIYPPVSYAMIDKIASDLLPFPSNNDPIGHAKNIEILATRINQCPNLEAFVGCYACIKTLPAKSEMLIYGISSDGVTIIASVLMTTPDDGPMTVASITYKATDNPNDGEVSCSSLEEAIWTDHQSVDASEQTLLAPLLDKMLADLIPEVSEDDIYGHEKNLQTFVDRLNECHKILKAEIDCYACLESYPPQSIVSLILFGGPNGEDELVEVEIYLLTSPKGAMTSSVRYK